MLSGDIEDVDIGVFEVSSVSLVFLSVLSAGGSEIGPVVGLSVVMFSSSSMDVEVSVGSVVDLGE